MRLVYTFFYIIAFLLIGINQVSAQEDWVINNFESDITIQQDGTVRVKESIDVDFGELEKHGIFRNIPYKYSGEDGRVYSEISNIRTGSDQLKIDKEGDYIQVRIGDPDKTISGKHTYTITYDVRGVLRRYESDELYWNVVGGHWPVPIEHARATVSIPPASITDFTCYQGPIGSTETCNAEKLNENTVNFTATRTLGNGSDLSIVVGYPAGIIEVPLIKSFGQRLVSPAAVGMLAATLFGGIGLIFWLWFYNGRDYIFRGKHIFDTKARKSTAPIGHHHTIVVEYSPPENLRPAEVGVLADEKADTLDVTSTIIDFAARGFLTITEVKKKWMFGKQDYTLNKTKKTPTALLDYEKKLYDELFDGKTEVSVSELRKEFYDELKQVKSQLYKDMVKKGYFPANPETVRNIYLGIGIAITVLAAMGFFFTIGIENEYLFMASIGIMVTGLNFLIVSRAMPRRTALGNEMYRRVKGYRLFISQVEKHRQQFFERKNMFNEVLPYAMVFGLTEKFAQGLEQIGYTPENVAWYHGASHFSPSQFQSSVSNFSSSMSSAMVSTPSGSGFSGGGGSSGGGFGGGGGGSW